MEIIEPHIKGLLVLKPKIYKDNRGYFLETWNQESFKNIGIDVNFSQDNQSLSKKGVVRGLHFQNPPYAQGKLVRVIKGEVLDVALDIRKNSITYGKYFSIKLSGENHVMFWIPPGFAHGFSTLKDDTIFSYKCTNPYNQKSENSISCMDPELAIDWKIKKPIISQKDQEAQFFSNFISKF